MAKDPAFLFYYQDFLVGTEFMSFEEVGIYIRILCHMADKGRLSVKHMQSICKGYAFSENIQAKLKVDSNGLYYNERLEVEIEKRRKYAESRRNNASGVKAYAKHMENENENRNKDISNNKSIVKSRPTLEQVLTYFLDRDYPKDEAEQFFNHYEALDWFNGNGMKITNWKAKAENWHKDQKIRNLDKETKANEANRRSNDRGKGSIDYEKYEALRKLQPAE